MAVSVTAPSAAARRGVVMALFAALALALGVAVFRPEMLPGGRGPAWTTFNEPVGRGVNGLKALGTTVAGIFESRSPGERIAGALASLKNRRHVALHERALPKIRQPMNPLAAIVGAPVVPPIAPPPAQTPLYNVVSGVPTPVPAATIVTPGSPPIVFPGFTPPPGGGGGVVVPPVVTAPPPETPPVTPVTPVTLVTSGVPEPATWMMMLMGFVMIGRALRRADRPVFAIGAR